MSEESLQECDDCIAPAEAFGVIANETRLEILEELWRADDRPVSFSELYSRMDMRDSAQFNYHLGKLTDHFIKKTDEGYDFRYAGKKVVRTIFSGAFNEDPEMEPFEIESPCVRCGQKLEASYFDEMLSIECTNCGKTHGRYPFPPGGLNGRTEDEIIDAFNQRVRHLHCLAADGVCPECNGRMRSTIVHDDGLLGLEVRVDHMCEQCRHRIHSSVGLKLLDQSDVVSFHSKHGIDLCSTPYWEFDWCVSDRHTKILSEDPWKIQIKIPLDDEELEVVLNGDLDVIDVEERSLGTVPDTKTTA